MNTVGSIIRLKRKEKGLKQKDIAALLHVSAAAVSKWENEKNLPDIGNLHALSVLLEIPMLELLEGLSPPGQSLPEPPEKPALKSEGSLEPSDDAIPYVKDTAFLETPVLSVSHPEDVSEHPISVKIRRKMKIAVSFLTFFLVGSISVCWIGVRMKGKVPSFTVRDACYDDYNGEYVCHLITEVKSDPYSDDLHVGTGDGYFDCGTHVHLIGYDKDGKEVYETCQWSAYYQYYVDKYEYRTGQQGSRTLQLDYMNHSVAMH